jgi:hypothetical protein
MGVTELSYFFTLGMRSYGLSLLMFNTIAGFWGYFDAFRLILTFLWSSCCFLAKVFSINIHKQHGAYCYLDVIEKKLREIKYVSANLVKLILITAVTICIFLE